MTEQIHTPGPWKVAEEGHMGRGRGVGIIDTDTGALVAEVGTGDDASAVTAAFIVKACNSHDALLDALRKLVKEAQGMSDQVHSEWCGAHPPGACDPSEIAQARAAIEKAEAS